MKKAIKKETLKLVVLISGSGTNLQAIIDAIDSGKLNAEIKLVISNKSDVYGLLRAKEHNIKTMVLPTKVKTSKTERRNYDAQLANIVQAEQADYIVLAGWLRLLSMAFLKHFPNRVVNLHPALAGKFAGLNAIERSYVAFQAGEIKQDETGIMVHFVPDEEVDSGPVIKQEIVEIFETDRLEDFADRMHKAEHKLLVESLISLSQGYQ